MAHHRAQRTVWEAARCGRVRGSLHKRRHGASASPAPARSRSLNRAERFLPLTPMRRAHPDVLACCRIHPSSKNTTARKHQRVYPASADHGELQVGANGCGCHSLPFHRSNLKLCRWSALISVNQPGCDRALASATARRPLHGVCEVLFSERLSDHRVAASSWLAT
jgi:hypothetical protein